VNIKSVTLTMKTSQRNLRGFLFIPCLFVLLSCSTFGKNNGTPDMSAPAVSFAAIESITEPQWQPFADGIGLFHGKLASPHLEFWALKVDLSEPGVAIVTRAGAGNGENSLSTKVTSFVRDNNLAAGINATPFDVVNSREGRPVKNVGIVISDGELLSPASRAYDALVFYKNGTAAVVRQSDIGENTAEIENAVGGFHKILAAGEPAERTHGREQRHPRSAAGVSANSRVLYLLVIDGRRAGSEGATEEETALILRALGSHDGINLDGGGSTALALRGENGTVRTANIPVNGLAGRERPVAGCLGVSLSRGR
jgi:hypothetical protein